MTTSFDPINKRIRIRMNCGFITGIASFLRIRYRQGDVVLRMTHKLRPDFSDLFKTTRVRCKVIAPTVVI
jgi:hypothetical protein